MKWITVDSIRTAEKVAFTQRGLPSYTAMCRAGAAVACRAECIARLTGIQRIVILCGPGNNGGDGLVAARCLKVDGFDVSVCLTCVPARLKGDAARAWKDWSVLGQEARIFPSCDAWLDSPWADPLVAPRRALIIDALLGIGASGVPRDAVAGAICWINRTSDKCPVLSVDVPSGLNADTGTAPGEAVRADSTITFSRPKVGFAAESARPYVGDLTVADIGISADLMEAGECDAPDGYELIAGPEVAKYLRPERRLDSHKRSYGHALIIGGSGRYPYAPVLSGLAAYRAGCGLVSLAVPEASRPAVAQYVPEAIFSQAPWEHLPDTADNPAPFAPKNVDAIAIGPGMGLLEGNRLEALRKLVSDTSLPRMVVDADALTAVAKLRRDGWEPDCTDLRMVFTPHPGEAARLLDTTVEEIQNDRLSAVRRLAETYHVIAVLKGNRTLVAEPGGRVHVCMGGNPGMATAGTGDVLTGIIVGLLARGLGMEDAACLSVYRHALAGDAAAMAHGQESLIASDIFATLRL